MTDLIVYALSLAVLLCFFVYWRVWAAKDDISLTGALVKTAATGGAAVAGWVLWLLQPDMTGLAALVALGLGFGALGDFALARKGETSFLAGMAAFAVGHLLYAYALWHFSQSLAQTCTDCQSPQALTSGQIAAIIGLAALMISTEFWLAPKTGSLRWPVRAYVMVIGTMALSVIMLVPRSGITVLHIGAALFVLSDLLLALRLFVVTTPRRITALSLLVWPIYWLGQILILYGSLIYMAPKG